MANIKFYGNESVPVEMYRARVVQKLNLLPIEQRRDTILESGCNTFLLKNRDIYLDMLTDSGTNSMSDKQLAAMMQADDAYAGSESFYRLQEACAHMFGTEYLLPAHQGRACENILATAYVTPGSVVPMNFHFTTTKSHITHMGGRVEEIVIDEGLDVNSTCSFKGNVDLAKLEELVAKEGADKIAFVRIEAGTNLIGGQPVSLQNFRDVSAFCRSKGIRFVIDASLLSDNLYFIHTREAGCKDTPLRDITLELGRLADIIYFSGRKLGCAKGGAILTSNRQCYEDMREYIPLYEGFLTYGGMSVREMEAIAVGLYETLNVEFIAQAPELIATFSKELQTRGIPVVLPAGGLGCHINATEFLPHLDQTQYIAGALAAAVYLVSGVRGMERGTMSEQREPDGSERFAEMELLRLAIPKRVFSLSQIKYVVDRLAWLYENRSLVGGLHYVEEPKIMRFFFGRLEPNSDWIDKLVAAFRRDFGDSL
ncbi:MAG: tryptophanase [Oscillospiraceae bacterium]|nr:tryptophanase [Oscillospiraceae bacterium]